MLSDFARFLAIKRGLAKETITGNVSRLRQLYTWLQKNNLELNKASTEQFLSEKCQSAANLRSYIYFLKSFELYLEDRGKPQDLVKGFKIPKVERPPIQVLTVDEVKKLLSTTIKYKKTYDRNIRAEKTYKVVTEFLYLTACRLEEACSLTVQNVNLGTGTVTFIHTKGKKYRYVPITEPLVSHLKPYIANKELSDLVFTNRMGHHIYKHDFWHNLQLRAKQAGITRHIYPHVLRHSAATHWITEGGVPIEIVSQILGHAEISTTFTNYVHLKDEQLRQSVYTLPYYRKHTDPKEVMQQIITGLKNYHLENDSRLNFKLIETGHSFNLTIAVK